MGEPKKWWEKLLLFVIMPIFDCFKRIVKSLIENKLILLLAGVYIIFHELFEELCTAKVVKYILSKCVSSSWNDVVFGIILLWAAILSVYRLYKRFNISDKRILISLILLFAWCYYRFIEHVWAFEPFTLWNGLKYVDAIAAFLMGSLLVRVFSYKGYVSNLLINIASYLEPKSTLLLRLQRFRHFKKNKLDNEPKGFCLDAPLSESGTDSLNREKVVEQICQRIKNTANKDASFAIGVTSEWGNGKTSFLNLIKRNLDKNQRVIIDYNPWLNSDRKSATLSFFDEMSSALKAYDSILSNDILKYAKMLIDSSADKYANLLNTCLSLDGTPTLRERFEEINDAIKRTKLQIIVFIDDLDRLYDSEILEVLSLIRNSANFSNTIFIVAYDRNYLVSALKKVNEYHPYAYLEKIFQLELPLPQFERDIIAKILKDKLLPYLSGKDKKELERIILISIQNYNNEKSLGLVGTQFFPDLILNGIKNIRDINRLVNSFLVSYNLLKGEIVLSDLLNVELLRVKYPGIYALLADNKDLYLYISNGSVELTKSAARTELETYLEKHFSEVGLVQTKIQDAMLYVFGVFQKDKSKPVKSESISHPIGINRYFHYQLLNSDISVIEFGNCRMKSDEEFQAQIKYWFCKDKNGIRNLLYEIEFYNGIEDYEKIIRAIFFYGSLLADRENYFSNDDSNILLSKLTEYTYSQFYLKREDFVQFLLSLFNEQEFPYLFASYFINNTLKNISKNAMPEFPLLEKDLLKQNIQYLKAYIDECKQVDKKLFLLYNNCYYTRWKKDANPLVPIFDSIEEADRLFVACANKYPANFMKIIFIMNNTGRNHKRRYSILSTVIDAFGSWDNFEAYLGSLDESKVEDIQLFTDFFVKLKNNEYRYTEFDFGKSVPYELIGGE